MKRFFSACLVFCSIVLLFTGCIVRSTYPWVKDDSVISCKPFLGTWIDSEKSVTLIFSEKDEQKSINIMYVETKKGKIEGLFTGSFHKLNGTTFLMVGPCEHDNMEGITSIPAWMVFKVGTKNEIMNLYEINPENFEKVMEKEKFPQLGTGNKSQGFTLLAPTENLIPLLKDNLESKDFYKDKPIFALRGEITGTEKNPSPAK
jgi:hypothetical protein